MRFKELLRPAEHASAPAHLKDRRRPGRPEQASPHLIPLLRDAPSAELSRPQPGPGGARPAKNNLAALRGIAAAAALSAPLWVSIAAVAWVLLR